MVKKMKKENRKKYDKLELYSELLKTKKELDFCSKMLKDYTDDWVRYQKKVMNLEKQLREDK